MKTSQIIMFVLGLIFGIWFCIYYWFWETSGMALLHFPFWVSLVITFLLVLVLILYEETLLSYIFIGICYILSVVLLAFHLFTLYGYILLYGVDIWNIVDVIGVMMDVDNVIILPVAMMAFITYALYLVRIYSRDECRPDGELTHICKS